MPNLTRKRANTYRTPTPTPEQLLGVGRRRLPAFNPTVMQKDRRREALMRLDKIVEDSIVTGSSYQLGVDDGMISAYKQSQHHKPGLRGMIEGINNRWMKNVIQRPRAQYTSEQGAASAASPSVFQFQLYVLRYSRRAKIEDCRLMIVDDPRARRATLMFAREAVRKGCVIVVNRKAKRGVGANIYARAQKIADHVQDIVNLKLLSWAWMCLVEGEVFVQAVVDAEGKNLLALKRMPCASMERLSDDADEIINPERAFAQVDVTSNSDVAYFPLALMHHERWNHIDGERYGESDIIAARRFRRLLELMEEAQVVRRMTRAAKKLIHNVGTPEHPGSPDAVSNYKESNGYVEGRRQAYNPNDTARDLFGNGLLKVEAIADDAGVSEVGDLQYIQNILVSAGYSTPGPLFNLDAAAVNRNVIDNLEQRWLKETVTLSDAMVHIVRWAVDLALLMAGILPEMVSYEVHFSESSMETASEIVNRVCKLRQNTRGTGMGATPDPLISKMNSLRLLAEIEDIYDLDAEMKAILEEEMQQIEQDMEHERQMLEMRAQFAPVAGTSLSNPGTTTPSREFIKPSPVSGARPRSGSLESRSASRTARLTGAGRGYTEPLSAKSNGNGNGNNGKKPVTAGR